MDYDLFVLLGYNSNSDTQIIFFKNNLNKLMLLHSTLFDQHGVNHCLMINMASITVPVV